MPDNSSSVPITMTLFLAVDNSTHLFAVAAYRSRRFQLVLSPPVNRNV
jgi:hypothetical protein